MGHMINTHKSIFKKKKIIVLGFIKEKYIVGSEINDGLFSCVHTVPGMYIKK